MRTPACTQVLESLPQGPLSAELGRHVEGCADCQRRVRGFGALEQAHAPAPRLEALQSARAAALAALREEPIARPWWKDALLLFALNLGVALAGTVLLARGRALIRNPASDSVVLGLGLLLLVLLGFGAYVAVAPQTRRARQVFLAMALITAGGVALLGGGVGDGRGLVAAGLPCMLTELSMTALPLAATLWLLARAAFNPLGTLAGGLAAGAAGMFALNLHCPIGLGAHLVLFHVAPWLVLAGVGLWVRSRMVTRSFAP